MNHSRLFATLTVLLLICCIIMLATGGGDRRGLWGLSGAAKPAGDARDTPSVDAQATMPAAADGEAKQFVAIVTDQDVAAAALRIPLLKQLPWSEPDIASAFKQSLGRSCRLLPPGTEVFPSQLNLAKSDAGANTRRLLALTVGLKVDAAARNQLPKLSKGAIESYLDQNLLAIQPDVVRNAAGDVSFTGLVRSAFFARSSPRNTRDAEAMINDAVGQFRVLGAIPAEGRPDLIKTLVLAFSYTRDEGNTTGLVTATPEFELLILHLLEKSARSEPEIAVFATTDGRETFQEIDVPKTLLTPSVTASIRFDSFKMMGLYPADPIVTGVRNRTRSSVPIAAFRSRLEGTQGQPQQSLADLLEDFHFNPKLVTKFLK
jgi:hypothetical protein